MDPPAFTRPLIHTLCTPDLHALLSSSNFDSLATLLSPFASDPAKSPALNNVQVRTPPNHEPRLLQHFPIEFRHRSLPPEWDASASPSVSASLAMKREGSTGAVMSQGQKDELFLDQLSTRVASSCSNPTTFPPEVHLDPTELWPRKRQYDLEGNVITATESGRSERAEWESKSLDDLTPWYKLFREEVFKRREMVEYETWGWPVGCILALSTNHPDPLNALSLLWDLTSPTQLYSPASTSPSSPANLQQQEFVNPDILRYILIVHDMRTSKDSSPTDANINGVTSLEQVKRLEETVKKTYGVHAKVLALWDHYEPLKLPDEVEKEGPARSIEEELSKLWPAQGIARDLATGTTQGLVGLGYLDAETQPPAASSASHVLSSGGQGTRGQGLSLVDLQNLSLFTREFVSQSLVPYLERTITVSNEQFNSSKKSLGGRLFSVGRKYFGSSSSSPTTGNSRAGSPVAGAAGGQLGYNSKRGYYPSHAQESQSRRLADLLFMLRDFKLAGSVYAEVAKDYKNDRAWKHYTAAVRMQGFCQLLNIAASSSASTPLPPNSLTNSNAPDQLLIASILPSSTPSPSPIDFDLLRSTMMYHHQYQLLHQYSTKLSSTILSRSSSTALMRLVDLSMEKASGGGDGEDELWCAMVCEQSALSQLGVNNSMRHSTATTGAADDRRARRERKFVLEMCLAGIRYEKSGLKSLSRRCLSQASSLYSLSAKPTPPTSLGSSPQPVTDNRQGLPSSFSAIRTYLHHSLARQAYNASQPLDAIYHFLKLLPSDASQHSSATWADHEHEAGVVVEGSEEIDWLDDFSLAWDLLGAGGEQAKAETIARDNKLELGLRLFDTKMVQVARRVTVGGSSATAARDAEASQDPKWKQLEAKMIQAVGTISPQGGQSVPRGELKGNLTDNQALVGETFYLELPIRNPLEAFLSIGDLTVQFRSTDGQTSDLEVDRSLDGDVVELAPLERRIIYLPMRGSTPGTHEFASLSYRFHNLLPVTESLSTPGRKTPPRSTTKPTSAAAPRLDRYPTVDLCQPIPILSVSAEALTTRLLHGQIETMRLTVKNTGQVGLKRLQGMSSRPESGFFLPSGLADEEPGPPQESKIDVANEIGGGSATVALMDDGDVLGPGQEREIDIVLRGNQVGETVCKWLFAYESTSLASTEEVYSARFEHRFEVSPSLEFRYATRPSSNQRHPFVLNLEAYNSGIPTEDLRIASLSILSPLWTATSSLPNGANPAMFSNPIPWQQVSNVSLALNRFDEGLEQCRESIEWSVRQVEGLLQGRKIEDCKPGPVRLNLSTVCAPNSPWPKGPSRPTLVESIVRSHSCQRAQSLALDFPTVPPRLLPFMFPLFAATASLILIEFHCPSLEVVGHHFLPLPSLGSAQNHLSDVLATAETKAGGLYAESQRERTALIESLRRSELGRDQDPAVVFIEVDDQSVGDHDFENGPCSVPINFVIRNISPTSPFDCCLRLGTTTDSALIYTGLLTRRCTIEPLSLHKVSTKAFVTREGQYDIGGWTLEVTTREGKTWAREGDKRPLRVGAARGVAARGATRPRTQLVDVAA